MAHTCSYSRTAKGNSTGSLALLNSLLPPEAQGRAEWAGKEGGGQVSSEEN